MIRNAKEKIKERDAKSFSHGKPLTREETKLTLSSLFTKDPVVGSFISNTIIPREKERFEDEDLITTGRPLLNVYDKYQKEYSNFLNKNKDSIRLFGNKKYNLKNAKNYIESEKASTITGKNENDLTPVPLFQKRSENQYSREMFHKVERSAVVMRRIEYTSRLRVIEKKKLRIGKIKKIQFAFRRYFHFKYKCSIRKIQRVFRGFLARKDFINETGVIRKFMKKASEIQKKKFTLFWNIFVVKCRSIPKKVEPAKIEFGIQKTEMNFERQKKNLQFEVQKNEIEYEKIKKAEPQFEVQKNDFEFEKKKKEEPLIATQDVIEIKSQPKIPPPPIVIEKVKTVVKEQCITSIFGIKEKLSGIKCFPRPRCEAGNHEKEIRRKMILERTKGIDTSFEVQNKTFTIVETPNVSPRSNKREKIFPTQKKEIPLNVVSAQTPVSPTKIMKKIVHKKFCKNWCFITKFNTNAKVSKVTLIQRNVKMYLKYKKRMTKLRVTAKIFLVLFSNIVHNSVKSTVMNIFYRRFVNVLGHKRSCSLMTIEDEMDIEDTNRIKQMKNNSLETLMKLYNIEYLDTEMESRFIKLSTGKGCDNSLFETNSPNTPDINNQTMTSPVSSNKITFIQL